MKHLNQVLIILLAMSVTALATTETAQAKGKPIKVEQAVPNVGERSKEISKLLIKGSNLPEKAEVRFLFNNPNDPADKRNGNPYQVEVSGTVLLLDDGDLQLDVEIDPEAFLGDYDIEVVDKSMSGRMGKGTTMFKVQVKASGEFSLNDIWASYDPLGEWVKGGAWEKGPSFYPGWFIDETWVNHTLEDGDIPRRCYVSANGNPPTAGRYSCDYEDIIGGMVSIDLSGIAEEWRQETQSDQANVWITPQNNKRKTYPGFCDLLNHWKEWKGTDLTTDEYVPLSFGTTRWYNIRFFEGCVDGYCPIEVHTPSYSGRTNNGDIKIHQFRDLTGLPGGIDDLPDVGKLNVSGHTEAVWLVNFPEEGDELNVFTEPQTLPIVRFEIKFFGDRHNNVLATCETVPGAVSNVYFLTDPVPDEGD